MSETRTVGYCNTYGVYLPYFFRKDCAVPQRVNICRIETVCLAIAIESLFAKTHLPNRSCEGQTSTLVNQDDKETYHT